jgi:hypothetical protein
MRKHILQKTKKTSQSQKVGVKMPLLVVDLIWNHTGVIQDGATSHCFILSGLAQPFLNRFQHINTFWT